MYDMLSSDILQVLIAVEGRYIQWEWDPQTLQNDYITLREADGHPVVRHEKSGREFSLRVARGVIQTLIGGRSVYEDESEWASGFRSHRPTEEGWSRSGFERHLSLQGAGVTATAISPRPRSRR